MVVRRLGHDADRRQEQKQGAEVAKPKPSRKSFKSARRDNIPERVESRVLQERISKAEPLAMGMRDLHRD